MPTSIRVWVWVTVLALASAACNVARARESVLRQQLFELRGAIDEYHSDYNALPTSFEELVEKGYIKAIPVDPMTSSASTWRLTTGERQPPYPLAAAGIRDVHSGSDRISLSTRTRYSNW
jgi:general secretion pathway protein G